MIVKHVFLLFFTLTSLVAGYIISGMSLYALCLYVTAVFFVLLTMIAMMRGVLSSGFAFLALYGLFHFGLAISYVFTPHLVDGFFMAVLQIEYIDRAFFIALAGAAAFFVGYLWSDNKSYKVPFEGCRSNNTGRVDIPWFWMFVFILFGLIYCYEGFRQGIFFAPRHVYISLSDSGNARVFGLARQLMILVSFVLLAKLPRRYVYWVPFALILLLSPMILSGKRGEFITILASYGVIMPLRGVNISRKQIVIALIVLVPLMSILRMERGGYETQGNAVTDLALEGGTQIRTVAYTIDAVNRGLISHQYGGTYLKSLAVVIPNIGGMRGTLLPDDKGPAQWFTEQYNNGGAGVGYSLVAEAHLNGGLFFVIVFMFGLGLLLLRFELKAVQSQLWLALFGAFLMSLFWWIRNDSAGFFRPVIWIILLYYIDYFIKLSLRRR